MERVCEQTTDMIVPVFYDTRQQPDPQYWQKKRFVVGNLYPHINRKVGATGAEGEICGFFAFDNNRRAAIGLPKNPRAEVRFIEHDRSYGVRIFSPELFLFGTGVGFVVLRVELTGEITADELIRFNYYVNERSENGRRCRFTYEDTKFDPQTKQKTALPRSFTLAELLASALVGLAGAQYKNYSTDTLAGEPDVTMFMHLMTDKKKPDREMQETLYRLAHVEKASYKPSERNLTDSPEVLAAFDNSYYRATIFGTAHYCLTTGDEETDAFFRTGYLDSFHKNYLFCYLMALHSKYMLVRYVSDVSELGTEFDRGDRAGEVLRQCRAIENDIIRFKLGYNVGVPSDIEHINGFYALVRRTLRVSELETELTGQLSAVRDICTNIVSARADKHRFRIEFVGFLIASIITMFTTITSIFELFDKVERLDSGRSAVQLIVGLALGLTVFMGTFLVSLVDKFKSRRR